MQITRIYTPQKLAAGQRVTLESGASRHLLRVLRLKTESPVTVFNGEGGEYQGRLVSNTKHDAIIELDQFMDVNRESALQIHLAQGVSRGERMDFVIQKATELGVAKITPLFSERTNVKLSGTRLNKRLEHWQQVAISACEQSGRCVLPQINEPKEYADFLKENETPGFICDVDSEATNQDYSRIQSAVSLLIGPEGGFSKEEIQQAEDKQFSSFSLGPRVLRTETAPIVALTLLQSRCGDLK